jgi:hypothetical protein
MTKKKKPSYEEEIVVIEEAQGILTDILVKWFGIVDNDRPFPTFRLKYGGYTATYCSELDEIALNYYSYRKMCLAQKRLLLIHEYFHKLGLKHSGLKSFLSANDLLSIKAYERIFGKDDAWKEFETEIDNILNNLGLKYH